MSRDRLQRTLAELAETAMDNYYNDWPERMQVDTWGIVYQELLAMGYDCFERQARLGCIWLAGTDEDREAAWAWWVRHCRGRLRYPRRQVKLWNVWGRWAPGYGIEYITTEYIVARDLRGGARC